MFQQEKAKEGEGRSLSRDGVKPIAVGSSVTPTLALRNPASPSSEKARFLYSKKNSPSACSK